MEERSQGNHGVDVAWLFLRANNEFKVDIDKSYDRSGSDCSDHIIVGGLKFKKYRYENVVLRDKWGVLNAPGSKDLSGNNVFWNPSVSANSLEAKVCKSSGLSLAEIFELPHVKVAGAIFECSGKCMIKITHGFQFYQLVLASAESIDHSKAIQLCIPMTEDFSTKIKAAQSLWELLKGKPNKEIDKVQSVRESLIIARHIEEGASHRKIALDLFGAESVSTNWAPDSWMRAKTRYSINKTKDLIRGGYRKLI